MLKKDFFNLKPVEETSPCQSLFQLVSMCCAEQWSSYILLYVPATVRTQSDPTLHISLFFSNFNMLAVITLLILNGNGDACSVLGGGGVVKASNAGHGTVIVKTRPKI